MTKQIWLNLPVKDVSKSKAFFTALGFSFNEQMSGKDSACLLVGEKNFVVMLFAESTFTGFTQHSLTDTQQSTEMLISIDAESPAEVDELYNKAVAAGGNGFAKPGPKDWMYGCGFADLDGHRWNVLYMDFSKLPQS